MIFLLHLLRLLPWKRLRPFLPVGRRQQQKETGPAVQRLHSEAGTDPPSPGEGQPEYWQRAGDIQFPGSWLQEADPRDTGSNSRVQAKQTKLRAVRTQHTLRIVSGFALK